MCYGRSTAINQESLVVLHSLWKWIKNSQLFQEERKRSKKLSQNASYVPRPSPGQTTWNATCVISTHWPAAQVTYATSAGRRSSDTIILFTMSCNALVVARQLSRRDCSMTAPSAASHTIVNKTSSGTCPSYTLRLRACLVARSAGLPLRTRLFWSGTVICFTSSTSPCTPVNSVALISELYTGLPNIGGPMTALPLMLPRARFVWPVLGL